MEMISTVQSVRYRMRRPRWYCFHFSRIRTNFVGTTQSIFRVHMTLGVPGEARKRPRVKTGEESRQLLTEGWGYSVYLACMRPWVQDQYYK